MAIEIGTVNADTSVKLGATTIQSGYIGYNNFYGTEFKILDFFPSAHHAYSLRKLRTAYTGACLRIRRTTTTPTVTTTTVDLSFDSNNTIGLDSSITYVSGTATTATNLGQFCASILNGYSNPDLVNVNQDIFISTWFDQSGNNKNVVSTTTTQQPRIVFGGNLETKDGKVAIRFIRTSSTRLTLADTSMDISNLSQYIVTSLVNTNVVTNFSAFRSSSIPWWLPVSSVSTTFINYNAGLAASGFLCQTNDTVNRLYSMVANTTDVTAFKNKTVVGAKASISSLSQYIALGWSGVIGTANALDGYIQESITWQNQLYVSPIQSNIITYYGI